MKLTIALSNLKKELLLGSFFAFTIKAGGVASAFALNIVIARNLGAEQAGYFFLAQTILLILAPFSRQGLDNCLIRFIAGYKDKDTNENNVAGIYRLALQRVTPVALSLSASLWFASEWLAIYVFSKPQLGSALKLCSLAITPLALAQLHAYCFQGKKRIVLSMLFESSALATLAFALICLIQPNNAQIQCDATY